MVPFLNDSQCYQEFLKDLCLVLCCFYFTWMTSTTVFLTVQMFGDCIAFYKEVTSPPDQELLQTDLNQVYALSHKRLLNLNPSKCDSMCISYKRSLPLLSINWEISHCPLSHPFDTWIFTSIPTLSGMTTLNL